PGPIAVTTSELWPEDSAYVKAMATTRSSTSGSFERETPPASLPGGQTWLIFTATTAARGEFA
ncbi:hypothetical protein, partial [Bradyrhizobium sp. Bra64]|uniref:hypothetical protein n=1 Tax=Bradyrhizobium sp. Bra64 TaxID=2926009 RepID=UPI0021183E03